MPASRGGARDHAAMESEERDALALTVSFRGWMFLMPIHVVGDKGGSRKVVRMIRWYFEPVRVRVVGRSLGLARACDVDGRLVKRENSLAPFPGTGIGSHRQFCPGWKIEEPLVVVVVVVVVGEQRVVDFRGEIVSLAPRESQSVVGAIGGSYVSEISRRLTLSVFTDWSAQTVLPRKRIAFDVAMDQLWFYIPRESSSRL